MNFSFFKTSTWKRMEIKRYNKNKTKNFSKRGKYWNWWQFQMLQEAVDVLWWQQPPPHHQYLATCSVLYLPTSIHNNAYTSISASRESDACLPACLIQLLLSTPMISSLKNHSSHVHLHKQQHVCRCMHTSSIDWWHTDNKIRKRLPVR